jgi:serine phosphatase RsbU (regulator of sigma subunit)
MFCPLEEGWILHAPGNNSQLHVMNRYFRNYTDSDYITRRLVYYQFILTTIAAGIFLFYLLHNLLVIHDTALTLIYMSGLIWLFGLVVLLYHGKRRLAGHGIILFSSLLVWYDSFLQPYQNQIIRMDNTNILLGITALSIFFLSSRAALIWGLINLTGFLAFTLQAHALFEIPEVYLTYLRIDGSIGFILVLLSAVFHSKLHTRARIKLEEHNRELEQNVRKRTAELNRSLEELTNARDSLKKYNSYLEQDRHMARQVQHNIIHDPFTQPEDFDIGILYQPCSDVSGDMYDLYVEDGQLRGLTFFDVSGHGVASGLVTILAKKIFFRSFGGRQDQSLNEIMKNIDQELRKDLGDAGLFLCGILMHIDPVSGEFSYVNSGHQAPLVLSPDGTPTVIAEKDFTNHGPYLGISMGRKEFRELKFTLKKDERLLLFTDALCEALQRQDDSGPDWIDKIRPILAELPPDMAAQEQVAVLEASVRSLIDEDWDDDLTILMLKQKHNTP